MIDVLDSPDRVIQQIAECEVIFSSSLHGQVVADSYMIPNFWTPLGDEVRGGRYKFDDYQSVFGREARSFDLVDAVSRVDSLKAGWSPPRTLGRVRRELLDSFLLPRKSR